MERVKGFEAVLLLLIYLILLVLRLTFVVQKEVQIVVQKCRWNRQPRQFALSDLLWVGIPPPYQPKFYFHGSLATAKSRVGTPHALPVAQPFMVEDDAHARWADSRSGID